MNPYDELGVSVHATSEEIRQKYKTLAQIHHPDKGGDEETFKRIKLELIQVSKMRHCTILHKCFLVSYQILIPNMITLYN